MKVILFININITSDIAPIRYTAGIADRHTPALYQDDRYNTHHSAQLHLCWTARTARPSDCCTHHRFAMSIAFNSGPAGVSLARVLVAFFATRNGRTATRHPSSRTLASTSTSSRDSFGDRFHDLWRADRHGLELDITSAQNSKVKRMR